MLTVITNGSIKMFKKFKEWIIYALTLIQIIKPIYAETNWESLQEIKLPVNLVKLKAAAQ